MVTLYSDGTNPGLLGIFGAYDGALIPEASYTFRTKVLSWLCRCGGMVNLKGGLPCPSIYFGTVFETYGGKPQTINKPSPI